MNEVKRRLLSVGKALHACPVCGYDRLYHLDDGRLMCRQCRKKFTPHLKTFRLPEACRRKIARSFWWKVSAEDAARRLGVNRKTMQRYYRHLRNEIAAASDREIVRYWEVQTGKYGNSTPAPQGQGQEATAPLCYLTAMDGIVRVVSAKISADTVDGAARQMPRVVLVVNQTLFGERYRLDDLSLKSAPGDELSGERRREFYLIEKFWKFARLQLAHYRAISTRNLLPLLKETEFRFNAKDAVLAEEFLISKLSSVPE